MDKLPKSTVSANLLWELKNTTGNPHILEHAIYFKLFNHLLALISAEKFAGKIGTKTELTSRLPGMLAILCIVTKKGEACTRTPPVEE